ncbi:unnamed protein product, partial [Staurois parvus]
SSLTAPDTLIGTEEFICPDQRCSLQYTPPPPKHTQHTVNPLITPDVNPFLPTVICTESALFISTDYCISVAGDVSGS